MTSKDLKDLWTEIDEKLYAKVSKNYLDHLKHSYNYYLKKAEITSFSQFESYKSIEKFVEYMKTKSKGRNGGIIKESQQKGHLKNLKKIMDTILIAERRIPLTEKYHFKENNFELYLEEHNFRDDRKHFKTFSFNAVKIWLQTIDDSEMKALYVLYSQGLRLNEPLRLIKSQFHLEERYIENIVRKGQNGGKIHEKFGLPLWCIPILEEHLKTIKNAEDKVFDFSYGKVKYFNKSHWNELKELREKLEKKEDLKTHWKFILDSIKELEKNGKFPSCHQFRRTWDSLALKNGMRSHYRLYHMNHAFGRNSEGEMTAAMDNVYIDIADNEENFGEYLNQLDNFSPKYL